MNPRIAEALEYCNQAGISSIVFAIPFPTSDEDVGLLRQHPLCRGVVLRNPSPALLAVSAADWLGSFTTTGGWCLPRVSGKLVFLGAPLMLTRHMFLQAVRSGRMSIICKLNGTYIRLSVYQFVLWRLRAKVMRRLGKSLLYRIHGLPPTHIVQRIARRAREVSLLRRLWRETFRHDGFGADRQLGERRPGRSEEDVYRELLRQARSQDISKRYQPVARRVLLVNAGLAAGGAERQIINTLIGLRDSGHCENVALLAEYINYAPGLDFFAQELKAAGIEVAQVKQSVVLVEDGLSSLDPALRESFAEIEYGLMEEILNLVEEFRARRPEVVHAWQDSTSIKVGIAAMITGVPRIVLASRNVTPMNFTYYQEYMRSIYRALAECDEVRFLNNSEAGASDYKQWLELPDGRISVVRNGADLSHLKRGSPMEVARYRQELGIPEAAMVVGSVFRFWAEKRPMLWLEAAAEVARSFPGTHFLIIGEGPLRPKMEKFVIARGLKGRVHLPGTRPDVALTLSVMDVFMLTSEFEGTPNVILEAQWLGVPVVATDSGGTRESFSSGATGRLVLEAVPAEIALPVSEFLACRSLRDAARKQGPDFVIKNFGITRMIAETLALYGIGPTQHPLDQAKAREVEQI